MNQQSNTEELTDTTITVTGYGGTIGFEIEMLRQALESWGYTVIIKDKHPANLPEEEMNEWCEERLALITKRKEKITLVADHRPWGG